VADAEGALEEKAGEVGGDVTATVKARAPGDIRNTTSVVKSHVIESAASAGIGWHRASKRSRMRL
jgi:hypothetical protein